MANTQKAPSAAKNGFDEAQTAGLYADQAKELGNAIFKKITSMSSNNALAEIHAKIATAASQEDDALLESLFADLKKAKNDQKNVADQYKTIRNSNSFETILQAYSEEFRELAYSVATEVIKGTHVALKNVKGRKSSTNDAGEGKGKRGPRTSVDHTITNGKGEKTVLVSRAGRAAANLTQDAETFAFLGFKIEKDEEGKEVLNPSTIKLNDGNEVPATRPNIVRAITDKTGLSDFTISA
ncbi:hypothetical protein [Pseudomonas coronafaciens]|uniref:hypothetical protein n=1 Tax=Pseudomonas coronafaciens TaxID=53409 RepID=UPI00379123FE